jgi:acetyltransferase
MWRYAENLRALYETPTPRVSADLAPATARAAIASALAEGRTLLDETESKAVLEGYGIPTVPTRTARTASEAAEVARALGFPVAVKLWSRVVTHKSDVGGVKLGLGDQAAVRKAFADIRAAVESKSPGSFLGVTVQPMIERGGGTELILGSSTDPQLGPVLLFGAGGELVEVLRDRALALPPLTTTLARRLIDETRISRALPGVRGRPPVDLEALAALIVRFSELVAAEPRIREIDVNPLLAGPGSQGLVALDARVLLHDPAIPVDRLPRSAIRPYPSEYVWDETCRDGTAFTIRPIRPDDERLMVAFHRTLSDESVRLRYHHGMSLDERTAHQRLVRVCFGDYDRELALVVEHRTPDGQPEIAALGRLSRDRDRNGEAEWALIVADPWQGRGLGRILLRRLIEVARREGIHHISSDILLMNLRMQRLCEQLGFELREDLDEKVVSAGLTF